MTSFTQGSALPNITTTQTKTETTPGYYTDYLTNLSNVGQEALKRPADQLVAGYDPLQTQGYGALPAAATSYQPGLSAATQTANLAAQGMSPELVQQYMNPYTQNVVNEMARQSQIALQRNLPTLKAGFVGSGGLGSQRYAGALGQSLADVQSNLTTAQAGALQKGYSEALDAAYRQAGLYNAAAKTQADLAKEEQELGLAGVGALTKAGAERQAYEQAKIDAPLKQAENVSKLMRGFQVPTSYQQTDVGPKTKDYYGTSGLTDVTGILATLGAINTDNPLYKNAADFLKRTFPSIFGSDSSSSSSDYTGSGINPDTSGFLPNPYGTTGGGSTDTSSNADTSGDYTYTSIFDQP